MQSGTDKKPGLVSKEMLIPFILVTTLFFMWGIPNNLNGVLIKQFMKSMEISRFQAGLVQSAFYLGYFALAVPAGIIMKYYSYKTGIVAGLLTYSAGCILFWPAAIIGQYWFFLLSLFVIASGLAFLETGANPFIALSGTQETSERRLNFSQAFNPIGSITGVLIGTIFIFSGFEPDESGIVAMKLSGEYESFLQNETMRVVKPYLFLAAFAVLWSLIILRIKFPRLEAVKTDGKDSHLNIRELLHFPQFWKGVLAQFLYVGAQVGTWSFFIPYVQDYTSQPEKVAGYFLTGTLVAFGIGRFSATWFMHYIKPLKLMGIYSVINILLTAASIIFPSWLGMWAIFFTSFFMSVMYPTIFATTIKGLGENTKIGGSILVMSIIGGSICTPLMGFIAERTDSMALAMVIPLIAYVYISYYSLFETNRNPL